MYDLYWSANSVSRSDMALSKSCASMAADTALVSRTASMSGLRTILFSVMAMKHVLVSGVASSTALTASTPCSVPNMRSYATAVPPRCTWPSVVIRVSSASPFLSARSAFNISQVILAPCLS
jgi:pectin methylesterase-like acyl-CoA thioesterase